MAAFLSQDPKLVDAYMHDQDVYSIIASSIYNMPYEDCLEFYPEGTELEIDGKKVIAGRKTHLNKSGKERRATGKTMVLAGNYGMSGAGAGSLMGKSAEEGQALLDKYFEMFGGLKNAIDVSKQALKDREYVEDVVGRRRRLPDINMDPYRADPVLKTAGTNPNFNPFFGCTDRKVANDPVKIWDQILKAYVIMSVAQHIALGEPAPVEMANSTFDWLKKIASNPAVSLNAKYNPKNDRSNTNEYKILSDLEKIFLPIIKERRYINKKVYRNKETFAVDRTLTDENGNYCNKDLSRLVRQYKELYGETIPVNILKEKVKLSAWTGKIAQAGRQCFNATIQGSSATLTKKAMIDIFNNEQLREWKAKLIITVHDEVLVECPEEYADNVEKLLPQIMVNAAKELGVTLPMKCDPFNVTRWYCDEYAVAIQEEFKKLEKGDEKKGIAPMLRDEALAKVIKNHIEIPEAAIIKTIETGCDLEF